MAAVVVRGGVGGGRAAGRKKENQERRRREKTYLDTVLEKMKVQAPAQRVPARPRQVTVHAPELLDGRERPDFADRVLVAHVLVLLPVLLSGRPDGQRVAVLKPVFHYREFFLLHHAHNLFVRSKLR